MIRLTWIGHATVVIDLGGIRVLTDPLLRPHAWLLRRVGAAPSAAQWRGTDAVLLSHLHADHAELGSLRMLRGIPVLTSPRNAQWLRRRLGPTVEPAVPGTWRRLTDDGEPAGHTATQSASHGVEDGVEVCLVRADHGHRPMPHRPNEANGFLVRSPSEAVYFAGDTSLYPEMADLPRIAGRRIDVALLPIAGWGPRLSGGHLGPAEAAEVCRLVGPRAVMPIHHGTLHPWGYQYLGLDWLRRPIGDFAREVNRVAPEVQLIDVPPGGTVEFG